LYQKKARTSLRQAVTSPVQARLPFRFAGRFFSGLSFTACPSA
jgi:hypothetical protein